MPGAIESEVEVSCPFCAPAVHRFRLTTRSVAVAGLTARGRTLTVTRLFACPITGKDFQASLRITEREGERLMELDIAPGQSSPPATGRA
jgi:hypothetical protein